MILRRRLKGDIVIEFEASRGEIYFIKFKDIRRIEKDLKNENSIRFSLDKYLNSDFSIKVNDRKKVLNEIKKYWAYFVEAREAEKLEKSQSENSGDFLNFERIKQILFK
jgi:hypothetical protein